LERSIIGDGVVDAAIRTFKRGGDSAFSQCRHADQAIVGDSRRDMAQIVLVANGIRTIMAAMPKLSTHFRRSLTLVTFV